MVYPDGPGVEVLNSDEATDDRMHRRYSQNRGDGR